MGIRILEAGLMTTIQDAGRFGYQQFGVSTSGAMDPFSLSLANILVDNDKNSEVLECTLMMPKIQFTKGNVFAVTGAKCEVYLNNIKLEMYKAYAAQTGDILSLSKIVYGCRTYIAFSGGLEVPSVLGSKSTYIVAHLGGLNGNPLVANDEVAFQAPKNTIQNISKRQVTEEFSCENIINNKIRVVPNSQQRMFSQKGIEAFYTQEYIVSKDSNRMGCRLEGNEIEHAPGCDGNIISDAIVTGSIQITSQGKPIIMMADHQTVGGYSKIGTVASVDLPVVAQLKPGEKLHFELCDVKTAQKLLKQRRCMLQKLEEYFNSEVYGNRNYYTITIDSKQYEVEVTEVL